MRTFLPTFIVLAFMYALPFSGCVYNKGELPAPDTCVCDTCIVSFSRDVQPIIQTKCYYENASTEKGSCHGPNHPDAATVQFTSYEGITESAGGYYINKMSDAINWREGALAMPYKDRGLPKLPACEISIIDKWLAQGHPNN